MGFGLGSFIIGKVYQAYTPAGIGGWRTSFLVLGVILFVVLAVGGFFFVRPPAGYHPRGAANAKDDKGDAALVAGERPNLTPVEMVRKPSF